MSQVVATANADAEAEQAIDALDWAYKNNVQILVHSSGEAAADLLTAAVQAAQDRHIAWSSSTSR